MALRESITELENWEVIPFVCPDALAISFQLPDMDGVAMDNASRTIQLNSGINRSVLHSNFSFLSVYLLAGYLYRIFSCRAFSKAFLLLDYMIMALGQ